MTIPEGLIRPVSGSAVETSITSDINETATTIPLQDASGYPSPAANQFVAVRLGEEGPNEEIIFYGTKNGNTLQNCLRGQDGTVARTHRTGEKALHTATALDFREANVHVNTTDPNFVPHANQLVHKSVAQTISADHTVSGNITHTGTTTFHGDAHADKLDVDLLTVDTIGGPVNVSGSITYSATTPVPTKVSGTTGAAGTPGAPPMRSDAIIPIDAKSIVRIMYPVGTIIPWMRSVLPDEEGHVGEWAFAEGGEVDNSTAPLYASKIGTLYGTASSGKSRLPDARGRHLVGVDTNHALGAKGGNYTHTNTVGEMASHSHNVNDPQHSHNPPNGYDYVISSPNAEQHWITGLAQAAGGAGNTQVTFTRNQSASTGISLQNTGGGQAYNIETPWIGMRYIVKVH